MRHLYFLVLALWVGHCAADPEALRAQILVHSFVAAGVSHHDAKIVWEHLKVGDRIHLVREPEHTRDPNAVRLDWEEWVLGYLPRQDNRFVARQLDRGAALQARIASIGKYRNNRRRLEIEIYAAIRTGSQRLSD